LKWIAAFKAETDYSSQYPESCPLSQAKNTAVQVIIADLHLPLTQ